MASEEEIQNMAISLSKTGVAANMIEALELARNLMSHHEEKAKLKEELKQKEQQERQARPFILPPVRLGVEGDIDLSKPLHELLAEPGERPVAPMPENTPTAQENPKPLSQEPVSVPPQTEQSPAPDLFTAFKAK